MKIFSWVHRHFHHKDVKKADHNDKLALLENEAFASACDVWKEGILAIGTFGIDLFQDHNNKAKDEGSFMNNNEVLVFGDVDDDHGHDHDEEECPLVLNASEHGFVHVEKQDLPTFDDEIAKPKNGQQDYGGKKVSTKIRKHGERTTLADLLRADSEKINSSQNNLLCDDHKMKVPYNHDNSTVTHESIKSFLIIKNKMKLVKDDSAQPIKKTKQLIKKMLKKKKIHPDISRNIQMKETASMITTQETDHVVLAT